MKKGKIKKSRNKCLSIAFIPHSSNKVKVLRFSSLFAKLFITVLIFFSILAAVFVSGSRHNFARIKNENQVLKQDVRELHCTNIQQQKLIEERTCEIERLNQENDDFYNGFYSIVNDKIEEFTESFNKITDEYIKERTSPKADRSGDRTETAFTNDIRALKEKLDSLTELYSRANKPKADLSAAEEKIAEYMETIPTIWPVASRRITDKFGYRKDPFTKKKVFHYGIDIGASTGSNIKAVASGKIILSATLSGYGRTVKIDHGRGLVTVYGHASKLLVTEGQTVKKGDIIAKVGNSGRSTGPHLHFEVLLYGEAVDPMDYLY